MMKTINYLFNFEKFEKMRHYLTNLLMNIYSKMNSLLVQTFGIQSLFRSIQFELDQIVNGRPNIAVT
jgi:hypothetical protein